jgi:hypothetical protein
VPIVPASVNGGVVAAAALFAVIGCVVATLAARRSGTFAAAWSDSSGGNGVGRVEGDVVTSASAFATRFSGQRMVSAAHVTAPIASIAAAVHSMELVCREFIVTCSILPDE